MAEARSALAKPTDREFVIARTRAPSIVVVALGEPGTPVVCWAVVGEETRMPTIAAANAKLVTRMIHLL